MQQIHIVVGNLPDDITEEAIREALGQFVPAGSVRLNKGSGTPSALVDVGGSRKHAEDLARRINGRSYQGRVLTAWVPRMNW